MAEVKCLLQALQPADFPSPAALGSTKDACPRSSNEEATGSPCPSHYPHLDAMYAYASDTHFQDRLDTQAAELDHL